MKERRHRNAVYEKMVELMSTDKAKNHILPISSLGIMQMTRQRQRPTTTNPGGRRNNNRLDAAALLAATDGGDADDAETFSHRPYASEFDEHPDLAPTWAVDGAFLDAFAGGFTKYRMGQWEEARAELLRTLHWPTRGGAGGDGDGGRGRGRREACRRRC